MLGARGTSKGGLVVAAATDPDSAGRWESAAPTSKRWRHGGVRPQKRGTSRLAFLALQALVTQRPTSKYASTSTRDAPKIAPRERLELR